jgi:pimeloyl-ACP methyl ester carboxylesterase
MQIASTDGVVLRVHDLGGDGPDVVLAHATGFHGRVWEPLATALTGFHCWSIDLRAHGDSALPEDVELVWDGFADDVLAVVHGLGLDRPFGVGHSKGGAALVLAEERRPGTFRALYCYEPVIPPSPQVSDEPALDNPLSVGARRRRPTFESFDAAFENYAGKAPFDALDPDVLRAYVHHGLAERPDGPVELKCRPEHEAQVYAWGVAHRAFDHLDEVRCPVTVAIGDPSSGGPAVFGPAVVAALPQGHLEQHPHLGHFGPLESPTEIALGVRRAFVGL